MGFSSQANDIGQICDAVVNGIKGNVDSLTTAANGGTFNPREMRAVEIAEGISRSLREIVLHLRVITNEDFEDET